MSRAKAPFRVLFSNPASRDDRVDMTVCASLDANGSRAAEEQT